MKPLLCDICGEQIKKPEEGWIEWRERFDTKEHVHYSWGAVIVHKLTPCQTCVRTSGNPRNMNDLELHMVTYPGGLEELQEQFRQTKLPKEESDAIIQRIIHAGFAAIKEQPRTEQRRRWNERTRVTQSVRYRILKRDGFQCVCCGNSGKEAKLVVDHILPIARGGNSNEENLQTLCTECNRGKGCD